MSSLSRSSSSSRSLRQSGPALSVGLADFEPIVPILGEPRWPAIRLTVSATRCQFRPRCRDRPLGVELTRQLVQALVEPLTPPLRSARRDTGFPAAASCLARSRACPAGEDSARGSDPQVQGAAGRSRTEGPQVAARGPGATGPSAASSVRLDPAWSSGDQDADRRRGCPVFCSPGDWAARTSLRSRWASVVPTARTRTGRQDTIVVIAHGARVTPGSGQQVVGDLPGHPQRE